MKFNPTASIVRISVKTGSVNSWGVSEYEKIGLVTGVNILIC